MRILTTAALPLLLVACGRSAPDDAADSLRAGSWTLSTTLGTPQGADPGREPPLTVQHCVSADQMPARDVILGLSSRNGCGTDNARFERGTIGGSLRCRGMDDISEHQEQISGSYTSGSFRMTIDMPVHGAVVRQTIEARRTGDC